MAYRICIIPGDGIGPEVISAAVEVLEAFKLDLRFAEAEAGWETFQKRSRSVPEETLQKIGESDATLFGAVSSPLQRVEGYRSAIITMRQAFDLYANVRPVKSLPISISRQGIDLVIYRENTEDLYIGKEIELDNGDTTEAVRRITRRGCERILRAAFQAARKRKRKLTYVHKANVLPITDGLFKRVALELAQQFPDIEVNEMLVDTMAMRLIREPENFDVIVTTNLFGDILSDEASELVGGLGIVASANIGDTIAIFEPVHGSAPDIAGRGVANPVAAILSASMMLDYLGYSRESERLYSSICDTLASGALTSDLGGDATTKELVREIIERLIS